MGVLRKKERKREGEKMKKGRGGRRKGEREAGREGEKAEKENLAPPLLCESLIFSVGHFAFSIR